MAGIEPESPRFCECATMTTRLLNNRHWEFKTIINTECQKKMNGAVQVLDLEPGSNFVDWTSCQVDLADVRNKTHKRFDLIFISFTFVYIMT